MVFIDFFKMLACIGLVSISFASSAENFSIIESKPVSEFWLNPGFYSYHFDKSRNLNNNDFGVGGEYRYSTVNSVTLGEFDNSDNKTSRYAGWYWQPIGLGSVRLGAVFGMLDGYPKMLNGDWFPAVIPTVSIEYKYIGVNLLLIPGYQDRLYASISLQLKLRVF